MCRGEVLETGSGEPAAARAAGGGELSPAEGVRLARLRSVTEALARAGTPDEVTSVAIGCCVAALGAARGLLLVHGPGGPLEIPGAGATAPEPRAPGPASGSIATALEALRRGSAVFVEGPAAGSSEGPVDADSAGAVAALPLAAGGRVLGVLVACFDAPREFPDADRAFATAVADACALALAHTRALSDARSATRIREEFLHVASHELRGPLGTLRLGVQLLLREVRTGGGRPPEARLHMIERQSERLVRLADALLDVSRITSGRLELARERADLAAVVREVAARHAAEGEAGALIGCDLPDALPCELDVGRMEQVLTNLLSNAVKYGRGRPIEVTLRGEGGAARLSIRDHGIGIAQADQVRIFDRFERAVSGRHYAGLGLGLWIVRQIVEAHGGTIRVRSAPDEGSTFVVELPLVAPSREGA